MTWTTRARSDLGGLSAILSGEGPPVLLIHGVGLCSDAWSVQIDALSTEFKVMAVDMPGHGDSVLPHSRMNLRDYSDSIAAILSEPTLIIGHSMGALIALDIAKLYPERTRGIAALNATYQRSETACKAVMARAEYLDGQSVVEPTDTLARWFGTTQSPERQACHDWLRNVDPEGYKAAYHVFAQNNGPTSGDLATLSCPAYFLTGRNEPNATPAMSRNMAALVPQGQAFVIKGAAHMMPMTHATEVNEILKGLARACFG